MVVVLRATWQHLPHEGERLLYVEKCYEGPRGSLISPPGLVGHAGYRSLAPSKQLVYIMYSVYSLWCGCCLQYMNRIRLLTLTDAVNHSLSFRLNAAQRGDPCLNAKNHVLFSLTFPWFLHIYVSVERYAKMFLHTVFKDCEKSVREVLCKWTHRSFKHLGFDS